MEARRKRGGYSAASDMIECGMRASQPSMKCFNRARSVMCFGAIGKCR
jgi:hypothetical protein